MRKLIFTAIILPFFGGISFAQVKTGSSKSSSSSSGEKSIAEKSFHSVGTTSFLDIYNGPIGEKFTSTTDPFGNTTSQYEYNRVTGYSYFTFIYHYRYNITEMNENTAFSVGAFPSVGLAQMQSYFDGSVIPTGYGCFNLPIMAGFELGAAATQTSNQPIGLYIGAGYEFNNAPMVYTRTKENSYIKTKWLNPCFSIGFRYERNMSFGTLQEINLKVGMGLSNTEFKEPNNLGTNLYQFPKAFTFRLSYLTYLNY